MAASVKQELGAAWEYAYDSGRLREDVPNGWRQIMKGRLQSKGALRNGEHKGTDKRVLSEEEIGRLIVRDYALLSPAIQDVLTLYLWTAARGAEIFAFHASHFSEEKGVLWATLLKSETKNKQRESASDFRFPLVGRAVAVVRARLAENPGGYLFQVAIHRGIFSNLMCKHKCTGGRGIKSRCLSVCHGKKRGRRHTRLDWKR